MRNVGAGCGHPALRISIDGIPYIAREGQSPSPTEWLQGVYASVVQADVGAVEHSGTSALGVHRALRTSQEVQAFIKRAGRSPPLRSAASECLHTGRRDAVTPPGR